jgi:hypothetical protein
MPERDEHEGFAMVRRSRRRQGECPADRLEIVLDTFDDLEMSYPETTEARRRELLAIRKELEK